MGMRRIFKGVSVLSAFFFLVSLIGVSVSWGQPLSMGRIELKGKGIVDAGKGLVFQAPKDKEAPLMPGSKVITEGKSSAVFDWSGKGSMVLYENSETGVGEDGFELMKGKLMLRMNPGQELKVKALDKIYIVKAPADKVGVATIEIKDNAVRIAGMIFLEGGGGGAVAAGGSALVPMLIAGGALAGGVAIAVSNNGGGGGGSASPYRP